MSKKILLKRSNQKESNGQPKLPLPSQIDYGELVINYAKDTETLAIKNSDNKIVTFNKINIVQTSGSSASNVMSQDAVTTELNKKADASDLDNYATKTALTSGLEGKADASHSHKAYQISGLDAQRALVSDGVGAIGSSAITSTELGYLGGVTSNIQTQLNNKANTSHTHTIADINGLDGVTLNNMISYYKFIHSAQNLQNGSTLTIPATDFNHLYQWNLPNASTDFLITLPGDWFSNYTAMADYYGWEIVIMINNPNTSAKTINFNTMNPNIDNNLIRVSHTFTMESKAQMYITLRFGNRFMFVEYNKQKKQL